MKRIGRCECPRTGFSSARTVRNDFTRISVMSKQPVVYSVKEKNASTKLKAGLPSVKSSLLDVMPDNT
ncbi:Hypothetical predicted protein [Octopus vulgaris]|uniref:Uncharacterized protein n=1 Tax=Octopus vulgaris TaxID=6645 RepID=A0AA36F5F1_OCTVU|nr:Hypothetical predicted protein [Octopus vulgaris]